MFLKGKAMGSNSKYFVLRRCCCLKWTVGVVLCLASVVLFWQWQPVVKMALLKVRRVKVHPLPPIGADVYMSMTVSIRNMDAYWMELKEVDVSVKYRGQKLGHVVSKGYHVSSWGTSHVFGELESNVLSSADATHLLKDLAKGTVHFHTVVEVSGHLGFLFYHFTSTFKIVLACDVVLNTKNHTIVHQHCVYKD